ncbi:MFS transporter [Caldimonas thermodepolymerans]|jgi:Cyanate permease|uniref:MFS transporter n=1 Tax=Caldimonas thermodepolymerans TaxID=215580 RepID=A0A2S5T3F9_9BURK|nr:MFS transporter [Caldimonas thermodepolymerans]PPE69524.1 MFS transporter [Caldimonas thermodepolymerans]QPC30961.1 MFS transporter [Caldimonas thermodepolymerans]RDH97025.1 CP family cyanate transporter-like MFS transporter [Caldimonas thermodepolymerans]TCP09072.1 CP family cyanate transporter-like MFS transporter [Caldimonas thermodepolymerans]UZG47368.1 MFS transporter [Caldimonas thermodepolymerans]
MSKPPLFRRAQLPAFLAFLLLAVNLRPAITAVGPLVGSIQETTGLSGTALGMLTSLPLLAFAAFSPLAGFARRLGLERTAACAMLMLLAGVLLRSAGPTAALYAGTLVLAAGIAVGNVLAPSFIKRDYAAHVGTLTTLYAMVLALSAAAGTGLAVPLERVLPGGWRGALAAWALPAAAAAILWARAFLRPRAPEPPADPVAANTSVWRSPLAWCVTAFMGLQSICFYVPVGWFPRVIQDAGYDPAVAGLMITAFQLVSLVASATMPRLLAARPDQRALAVFASLVILTGVLGLMLHPAWALLWVSLAGLGSGLSFPLALAFIGLRTTDHRQAASLSLMSQSIGYLLAAAGPLLFGLAHDLSGGWTAPLAGLAASTVVLAVVGYRAGQARTISGAGG